jgi:hypothetical protein
VTGWTYRRHDERLQEGERMLEGELKELEATRQGKKTRRKLRRRDGEERSDTCD